MESRYGRTEFRSFTHAQLVDMLAAGRPGEVAAGADSWCDLANLLDDVALTLERQHGDLQGRWEGSAAQAHADMVRALLDGLRQAAWAARRTGDQVSAATEALRRAQERMAALGPPLDLHPPDQAVVAAAATPLPYGQARIEAAARQAAAVRAIQDFQRGQAAAGALAEAAAAIMDGLRAQYDNVEFPAPPSVAEPPTLAPDGTPIYATAAAGAGPGSQPLLTDLWGSGLAAAAGLPPASALPPYQADPTAPSGPLPGVGTMPPAAAVPLDAGGPSGSLAGAAVSVGSFPGAGLAGAAGRAVGQSSLAPTIDPAAAAGRAATGTAAVQPFLGGGFAPPMGGGDLGGAGGRGGAAAWLVGEVEEFGVRAPVVPQLVD